MGFKKFNCDKNNSPVEIIMNDNKNETHALIRITKGLYCKHFVITFTDLGSSTPKTIPVRTFTQLDLVKYYKFTILTDFSNPNGFIEAEVYTGSWEEMILTEVELSFSDLPFFIRFNTEKTEFIVGADNESRMEVKPDIDGGFNIVSTIVFAPGQQATVKHFFQDNSDGAQIVKRLYGMIKGLVTQDGFIQKQEENKTKLSQNFHKTITDGFHPIGG